MSIMLRKVRSASILDDSKRTFGCICSRYGTWPLVDSHRSVVHGERRRIRQCVGLVRQRAGMQVARVQDRDLYVKLLDLSHPWDVGDEVEYYRESEPMSGSLRQSADARGINRG